MIKSLKFLLIIGFCFPSYAQINEMSAAFKNKEYDKVIELGKQLFEVQPTNINGLLAVGQSYNRLNDFKNAIPYLEKAINHSEQNWQYAWANIELMESHFALGNNIEAKEHFNESLRYKGTQNSNKKLKRLALLFGLGEYFKNWETIEGENIIFHFQEGVKISDNKKYMKDREKAYLNINSFFSSDLPKKIDFFVWKSNDEALRILGKSLGFTNAKYCTSHNRPNQTKGHEIAHNISFWTSNAVEATRFINEGIGVYFDCSNRDRMFEAKKVGSSMEIDVKEFWVHGGNYAEELLYPVAGAFVEYLISFDKKKFMELSKNQTYEKAKMIYGQQLDELISKFNDKINNEFDR